MLLLSDCPFLVRLGRWVVVEVVVVVVLGGGGSGGEGSGGSECSTTKKCSDTAGWPAAVSAASQAVAVCAALRAPAAAVLVVGHCG